MNPCQECVYDGDIDGKDPEGNFITDTPPGICLPIQRDLYLGPDGEAPPAAGTGALPPTIIKRCTLPHETTRVAQAQNENLNAHANALDQTLLPTDSLSQYHEYNSNYDCRQALTCRKFNKMSKSTDQVTGYNEYCQSQFHPVEKIKKNDVLTRWEDSYAPCSNTLVN